MNDLTQSIDVILLFAIFYNKYPALLFIGLLIFINFPSFQLDFNSDLAMSIGPNFEGRCSIFFILFLAISNKPYIVSIPTNLSSYQKYLG